MLSVEKVSCSSSRSSAELIPLRNEKRRRKRTIFALILVSFCNGLQMSIYYNTLWPFAIRIDPSLTVSFFGYIAAAFSVGQGLSSLLLGFWMDKWNSVKIPLVFSTVVLSFSNLIFCCSGDFGVGFRKWILLLSRIVLGIGGGSVSITRARAPVVCTDSERTRVVALVQLSYTIGTVFGPLFQHLGSESDVSLGSWIPFQWNSFTAGPLIMAILNILLVLLIHLLIDDFVPKKEEFLPDEETLSSSMNLSVFFAWMFASVCGKLIVAHIECVFSIFTQLMWNLSNEETLSTTGHLFSLSGIIQIIVYILFSVFLKKSIGYRSEVKFLIFGLLLGVLFYVLSAPFPFSSEILDCSTFSWCSETHRVNFWLFSFAFSLLLSAHFPIVGIYLSTILFTATGGRKQGTLMGLIMFLGSAAKIGGQVLISLVFEEFGPNVLWLFMIILISTCTIWWIEIYRKCNKHEK